MLTQSRPSKFERQVGERDSRNARYYTQFFLLGSTLPDEKKNFFSGFEGDTSNDPRHISGETNASVASAAVQNLTQTNNQQQHEDESYCLEKHLSSLLPSPIFAKKDEVRLVSFGVQVVALQ